MKKDTLKEFAKTLSESAPIHYGRGTYSPDTTATTPGDLVLSITGRANNRVKGTVTGTIYRSNVGQNLIPPKLSCTIRSFAHCRAMIPEARYILNIMVRLLPD